MRSALFWDVTQRIPVNTCRRFGTTYSIFKVQEFSTLEDGADWLSQNVVGNYQHALRNITEERISNVKSIIILP